ncbi:MAG TPA: sugar ABC transporter permease [Acidimicrobiia bacterium]|nr:sugar ABC transporter permease [Acidimicrobiia bacterium]
MSVVEAPPTQSDTLEPGPRRSLGSYLRDNEIDTRMVGMVVVLLAIWIVFHLLSGGTFITPRNLWNLSVQFSAIAIMATGMVLVIVSRNIDLSVGSMVGTVGMVMAVLQAEWLPPVLGAGNSWIWLISLIIGVVLGALIGAFQGSIVAYVGVPSFIVTLGGLLVWRGFAWLTASGRTIAPMDPTFQLLGGGSSGSLGETGSWIVGGVACVGIVALLLMGRRRRRKFGFRLRPAWLDVVLGVLGCAVVLGAVWVMNSYYLPENLAIRYAEEHGIPIPEGGLQIPLGIPYPVLILVGVTLVMSYVTNRLRFGRYVFSIGGNPEAASLAGIKTKRTIVRVFMTMGILVAVSAAVSIARLNAAVSGLGTLNELYVIAAAVIGGTSLSGGIGTIPGAILGALVMQSLQSGMVLIGVGAPVQDVVLGVTLVVAVAIDTIYRRRAAR